MGMNNSIEKAMLKYGIEQFRDSQEEAVYGVLYGHDTFVIAKTSSGKSVDYIVPGLVMAPKITLVIVPTISLGVTQVQKLQQRGIGAAMISSKMELSVKHIENEIEDHRIIFLYVTPERLHKKKFQKLINRYCPGIIVIDEAHCVSDWGASMFRTDYLRIGDFIDQLSIRPTVIALTATAPIEDRKFISESLHLINPNIIVSSLVRENITIEKIKCNYKNREKRYMKVQETIRLYSGGGSVVIYCSTKDNVDVIFDYLNAQEEFEDNVTIYYSDLSESDHKINAIDFIDDRKKIIVATSAFGLGIDNPNVDLVIHFNMPFSIVDWYQQISRGGRAGQPATAVLLYQTDDIDNNRSIIKSKRFREISGDNESNIDQVTNLCLQKFDDLVSLFDSKKCFMKSALKYLGEESAKNCCRCSNCRKKGKK